MNHKCVVLILYVVLAVNWLSFNKLGFHYCLLPAERVVDTLQFTLVTGAIEAHTCTLAAEIKVLAMRDTFVEFADENISMVMDEDASARWLALAVEGSVVDRIFVLDEAVIGEYG